MPIPWARRLRKFTAPILWRKARMVWCLWISTPHERLVYEAIKAQWAEEGIARQALLIPQTIELGVERCELVLTQAEALAEWGLEVEAFGESTLLVRSLPALLDPAAASDLLNDLADEIQEWDARYRLKKSCTMSLRLLPATAQYALDVSSA